MRGRRFVDDAVDGGSRKRLLIGLAVAVVALEGRCAGSAAQLFIGHPVTVGARDGASGASGRGAFIRIAIRLRAD